MNNYPFGIDISRYQYSGDGKQKPDFEKMRANTSYVAVRAGISWGYQDPWFRHSWDNLDGHNRLAYHVPHFGEDPMRQMDSFFRIIEGSDFNHDRLVLDLELDHGHSKRKITDSVKSMLEICKTRTGRYPILYSRATWVNPFMYATEIPTEVDWWFANYLAPRPEPQYTPEKTPPPLLPVGIRKWLIHQTAEKGNGSAVGVASYYVDTNRWNGTMEDMNAYFGRGQSTNPPEKPPVEIEPPEEEEELFKIKCVTVPPNRYRVYKSMNGLVLPREQYWLKSGDIRSVYEVKQGWYRIAKEQWIRQTQYIKKINEDEEDDGDVGDTPYGAYTAYFGPIYNQRDTRWAKHPLGTKSTIGDNGCLLNCASMVANALGHASNPYQLNLWYTHNGGYASGNLFIWEKLPQLYPDIKYNGMVYNPSPAKIKEAIRKNELPIIYVDFNDKTPYIEMHWVLGIGIDMDDNILVADPWTGTIVRLYEVYSKPVVRYASYSKK